MVLEQRGTTFGVPSSQYSGIDYSKLMTEGGDTRRRVFNVESACSTFNRLDKSFGYPQRGVLQTGEYVMPPKPVVTLANQPHMVKGFHVSDRDNQRCENEHLRKCGSLPRNIVGNCTIKDQYHSYHGHTRSHYGHHVGSKNEVAYRKELNLGLDDFVGYGAQNKPVPKGHAREYRCNGAAIGFQRPGKAQVDQDMLLKQPHDLRPREFSTSRFQYGTTEMKDDRFRTGKTAMHSGLKKPFSTVPSLHGPLTGPHHAIDRPPPDILGKK